MMTLRQLAAEPSMIPTRTSWYLADLAEARGKQELFTRQSPQKLKVLREHALIESAVSSNRIEGVEVDQARIGTLIFGKPALRDRDEEEVRGYRDALKLVHESGATLPITEATIKRLHKLSRGEIWDAGAYKEKDVDIIQKYADGRSRVRFKTVPANQTPQCMAEMTGLWERGLRERWAHPFVLLCALNLDFLCIHPFRDGNGRVSRLLFLPGQTRQNREHSSGQITNPTRSGFWANGNCPAVARTDSRFGVPVSRRAHPRRLQPPRWTMHNGG